ncbi:MAG: peptide-methionine (S)-S-oxide reductase MsrA [Candidatus Caenarcaniphilales bacterium]|nr:peptide-methionine (S)-S-oxide reductase MsrA [Candidatus Caenarcaniphilales bacterium]
MASNETAIFAAGCFWGVERAFQDLSGVKSTVVGYCGGESPDPTYEKVCTGRTGHAESVLIEFDPLVLQYSQLLEVFWKIHDPTTFNRQGPDIGSQYRSAIFCTNDRQSQIAHESMHKAQAKFQFPIVTQIAAAGEFYPAEEYHQSYLKKKGR